MSQVNCPQEAAVVKAVRSGTWEEGLSDHVTRCADCREVVQSSQWMQALAESCEKPELPDASLLWGNAHLSERLAKTEKAQDFLDWLEIISGVVVAASLAAWIGWNWVAIQSMFVSLLIDVWPQFWIAAVSVADLTAIILVLGAVIPSLIAVALVYPIVVRE